jgi:hypothetical protein
MRTGVCQGLYLFGVGVRSVLPDCDFGKEWKNGLLSIAVNHFIGLWYCWQVPVMLGSLLLGGATYSLRQYGGKKSTSSIFMPSIKCNFVCLRSQRWRAL